MTMETIEDAPLPEVIAPEPPRNAVLLQMSHDYKALVPGLVAAQLAYGELKAAAEGTTGGHDYKYADLAMVLAAVRPALNKNGIAIVQVTAPDPYLGDRERCLYTMLLHESGAWIQSYWPLPWFEKPQDQGIFTTYTKRYQALAICGCHPAGDDNDGNMETAKRTRYYDDDRRPDPEQRRGVQQRRVEHVNAPQVQTDAPQDQRMQSSAPAAAPTQTPSTPDQEKRFKDFHEKTKKLIAACEDPVIMDNILLANAKGITSLQNGTPALYDDLLATAGARRMALNTQPTVEEREAMIRIAARDSGRENMPVDDSDFPGDRK